MAKYTVTISEMSSASAAFKDQAENFRNTAASMLAATDALTQAGGGWDDDASQVFHEKMTELRGWCDTMSGYIDEFSQALPKIANEYNEADQQSAAQFRR